MKLFKLFITLWDYFNAFCVWLSPLSDLIIRLYLWTVFFDSGFTKLTSIPTTISLFKLEYQVPFCSPVFAAYTSLLIELGMSTLLLIGLGGRIPALVLFLFNVMCTLSYPFLWTDAGHVGLIHHFFWGLLFMTLLFHGNGKLSVDHLIYWLYHRRSK